MNLYPFIARLSDVVSSRFIIFWYSIFILSSISKTISNDQYFTVFFLVVCKFLVLYLIHLLFLYFLFYHAVFAASIPVFVTVSINFYYIYRQIFLQMTKIHILQYIFYISALLNYPILIISTQLLNSY